MPGTQVCMFCRYRGTPRQDGPGAPGCPHDRSARVNDEAGPAWNALPAPAGQRLGTGAPTLPRRL